ncbi:MAG: ATP-binding protein, partial [Bacteroidota bacterium]
EKKKDFANAYKFQKEAKSLGDSLAQKKYDKQASELNIKYETQQKETQIALQEAALSKASYRRNLILILGLALLGLTGAGFLLYRIRQSAQQKLIETELRNQQREAGRLKELDQLKSHFFANISHEFRTPLSLILGPLKELRKGSLKGDIHSFQDLMIRNGERLLTLVNQLLELSKLEAGQLKIDPKAGDINRFIRTLVNSFESLALEKNISFQTSFGLEPVIASFDADKLEKIISNLLSNAFKFSPQGGIVSFEQNLLPSQDPNQIRLECIISDNGPGIKEEEMRFIFQRFYTKGGDESRQEGVGIGLALARELVELFKGDIWVKSKEGEGSSFHVLLKLPKANEEEYEEISDTEIATPLISASEISKSKDLLSAEKPLVLIVEDNADMRLYLWEQLRDPYQIISASSAEDGLKLAKAQIPDLVISDWMLPGMEGTELIHEIRSDFKTSHIPVIMLTAKSSQEDLMEGIEKGADAFVKKPFEADELKLRIEKLIQQRKNLQEVYGKIAESTSIQITATEVESQEEIFLRRLVEIIEEELDNEEFSIPKLSKEIGMSRSQLHRKLKALTDKSPSAFLRSVRLQHAYELLQQKSGNISEVAIQVGIPNLSYFSRVFSEQFGYPPSEILQNS